MRLILTQKARKAQKNRYGLIGFNGFYSMHNCVTYYPLATISSECYRSLERDQKLHFR